MASKAKRKVSKQATFNKVVRGLIKQGKRAMDETQCVYRADDGSKCAAGQLIPAKLYSPKMEGAQMMEWASNGSRLSKAGRVIKNLGHDIPLVQDCQEAHDNDNYTDSFTAVIDRLVVIAESHDLDLPKELYL